MSDKRLIAILVRHGDTDVNDANQFRSRLDPPLNSKGVSQAEAVAKAIKDSGAEVKKVIAGPLLRTVQTADIIAEQYGLPVEQDRGLISWSLGFMSGQDKEEYKELLDYYIDNPKSVPPKGESLDDLEQRTFEFFERNLRNDELTVFTTHNSNCVTVENQIAGSNTGRPESGEATVGPGGAIGIFVDEGGKYSTEVLFGVEKPAQYGS